MRVLSFRTDPIGPIPADGSRLPLDDQLAAAMEGSIDGRMPS